MVKYMKEENIRSFIPKTLRPDVAGSAYSISSNIEEKLSVTKILEDLDITKILDLKTRSMIIIQLFKLISCIVEPELEYVENLRSCIVNARKENE